MKSHVVYTRTSPRTLLWKWRHHQRNKTPDEDSHASVLPGVIGEELRGGMQATRTQTLQRPWHFIKSKRKIRFGRTLGHVWPLWQSSGDEGQRGKQSQFWPRSSRKLSEARCFSSSRPLFAKHLRDVGENYSGVRIKGNFERNVNQLDICNETVMTVSGFVHHLTLVTCWFDVLMQKSSLTNAKI